MNLREIKKLKVADLRMQLKKLGLNTKGLKGELIGRLWSACEAGLHETQAGTGSNALNNQEVPGCIEVKTQNESLYPEPKITIEAEFPLSIENVEAHDKEEETVMANDGHAPDATSSLPAETHVSFYREVAVAPSFSELFGACKPYNSSKFRDSSTQTESEVNLLTTGKLSVDTPLCEVLEGRNTDLAMSKKLSGIDSDSNRETQSCNHTDSQKLNGEIADEEDQSRPILLEEMGRGRAYYDFKEEIRYKRAKKPQPQPEPSMVDDDDEKDEERVRLDPYACDLHFMHGPDGCSGQPRFWARFPLLWSGCRLSHGARRGRVGFEVRLEGKLLALGLGAQSEVDRDPEPYGLRVGWSVGSSSLQLGEDEMSYGYDGHGSKVTAGKEETYGEAFSESDIIGCYVSFSEDGSAQLSYCKNGRPLGTAFQLSPSVLRGRTLYPHVLCKNCMVRLHLDPTAPPWYHSPLGYTPIAALPARDRPCSPLPPISKKHCEVVMMVGLPGAGKSHWARTYMKRHPEKHFTLLGTTALLACMRGKGLKESRLQQASQCLTELIKMAANNPRNYILDQPNVHHSARHHKLLLFEGFLRRAVVVFPATEEWRRRLGERQRQESEEIPTTALLKLQVSCSFPEQHGEMLDEVEYAELPQDEAHALLQEYKDAAHRLLPPAPRRQRRKTPANHKRPSPYVVLNTHDGQWDGRKGGNYERLNQQLCGYQPNWEFQPRYWDQNIQGQGYYSNRGYGCSSYQGYW